MSHSRERSSCELHCYMPAVWLQLSVIIVFAFVQLQLFKEFACLRQFYKRHCWESMVQHEHCLGSFTDFFFFLSIFLIFCPVTWKKIHSSFSMMYIQHVHKDGTENKRKPESPSRHDWFLYHSWNSNQLLGQYIKSALNGFVIIHICRAVMVLSVNLDFPPILLSFLLA